MPTCTSVDQLVDLLKQDARDRFPRYPGQAATALQDDRIRKLVESRLEAGEVLDEIVDVGYSLYTGINNIRFSFLHSTLRLASSSILVMLRADTGAVAGIIDDFDPDRPNRLFRSFPREAGVPFVLGRPSILKQMTLDQDRVQRIRMQVKALLKAYGIDDDDGPLQGNTNCVITTGTLVIEFDPQGDYESESSQADETTEADDSG